MGQLTWCHMLDGAGALGWPMAGSSARGSPRMLVCIHSSTVCTDPMLCQACKPTLHTRSGLLTAVNHSSSLRVGPGGLSTTVLVSIVRHWVLQKIALISACEWGVELLWEAGLHGGCWAPDTASS